MTSRFFAQYSLCNNFLANSIKEQDKFVGPQSLAKRSDASNNKAFTSFETFILSFVFYIKNFFTKFIKVFVKSTQAKNQEQTDT